MAEEARGREAAGNLIEAAHTWFAAKGRTLARVSTQARNVSSLRLYERHGFVTESIQLWNHWWPLRTEEGLD